MKLFSFALYSLVCQLDSLKSCFLFLMASGFTVEDVIGKKETKLKKKKMESHISHPGEDISEAEAPTNMHSCQL